MAKTKRTMEERGQSVKDYAKLGALGGGAIGGYAQYREDKKFFDALKNSFSGGGGIFNIDTSDMKFKPDKLPIAKSALKGALAGALATGLWRLGTELGGSMDDDSYEGRLVGGFIGNPILGLVGSPLSALETYLLREKSKQR